MATGKKRAITQIAHGQIPIIEYISVEFAKLQSFLRADIIDRDVCIEAPDNDGSRLLKESVKDCYQTDSCNRICWKWVSKKAELFVIDSYRGSNLLRFIWSFTDKILLPEIPLHTYLLLGSPVNQPAKELQLELIACSADPDLGITMGWERWFCQKLRQAVANAGISVFLYQSGSTKTQS